MPKIFNKTIKKSFILEHVGDIAQICDARRMQFTEGKSAGVDMIDVRTGSGFSFTVLPSRGLDISVASFKGIPIVWRSAAGETSPFLYQPEGGEWTYSFFGGLLTTCGMSYSGHPCNDGGKELGLHGRTSNIPAEDVNVIKEWNGDDFIITITGNIREYNVFGDNLMCHRIITTSLGAQNVLVKDTIENAGFKTSPLMMLYHVNAGWPVLSKNSWLVSPSKTVTPRDDAAKVEAEKWGSFLPPTKDFAERVYFHDMVPDSDGMVKLALVNDEIGIGFYEKFPKAEFPYFVQWKMMGQGEYVVGMEPSNFTSTRADMRKRGLLEFIEPGQRRNFTLELGVLYGQEEIAALKNKVKKILSK